MMVHPGIIVSYSLALALNQERKYEDAEQEDKLNERKCDQHLHLQLADSLRLSSHALQGAISNKSKSDTAAQSGYTNS